MNLVTGTAVPTAKSKHLNHSLKELTLLNKLIFRSVSMSRKDCRSTCSKSIWGSFQVSFNFCKYTLVCRYTINIHLLKSNLQILILWHSANQSSASCKTVYFKPDIWKLLVQVWVENNHNYLLNKITQKWGKGGMI